MLTEQPSAPEALPAASADDQAAAAARAHRWLVRGLVAAAMLIFAALCFYQYDLPGLYYDEAFDAVPAMQLLQGSPVHLSRDVGLKLFGRSFPVMIGDYWGVVSTYAVLPLFWLFGVGVFAIRLWPISAGTLAVLLTYLIGRRIYDRWVGASAALLLAVFPSYIFWTRVGIYVIAHIVAVVLGIFLCYLAWRGRKELGKSRWLFVAGLLAGIGLSTKLLFVWFLIAVPVAYLVLLFADWLSEDRHIAFSRGESIDLAIDRLQRDLPFRNRREALLPLLGFLIGAFPVLYYNLMSRGSYLVLRANLFQTERGVDNFAFWQNLKTEADALRVLLNGGYFWFYGGIYKNPIYPWVVGVSALVLLVLVHRVPTLRRCRRPTVFFLGFATAIFLLSCFTVSILAATHLLIMLPIPQLLVAGSAIFGARWLAGKLRQRLRPALTTAAVIGLLLVPLIGRDLWVDAQYHRALAATGGYEGFSSAIYELADYLDEQGITRPYALDWGFKWNVMILTEGRVEPLEIFGGTFEPGPDFEAAVAAALATPDPVFLARTEEGSTFHRLEPFEQLVRAHGYTLQLERTFTHRDGKPVYYLFRLGE